MFATGFGPSLESSAICPDCGALFERWSSYPRRIRLPGQSWRRIRIRRVHCKGCGRTHAVLPSFAYANRFDCSGVIWGAIEAAAGGRGYRPIAAGSGVPATTVRDWLRRIRREREPRRRYFAALCPQLGAAVPRGPPGGGLASLVEVVEVAHQAAKTRFGDAAVGSIGAFSSASCSG